MSDLIDDMDFYLRKLFPLCRSITGEPNRETLRILQEIIPLTIHEVPSGTTVYDWIVPDEWNAHCAWIEDAGGHRIIDFENSNLHLVSYSEPVNRRIDWMELKNHIHVHQSLPNAIPYRTTYYKRGWGFCVTHEQYDELAKARGPFSVFIDSEFTRGSLTYGELLLPGKSQNEFLISCYICHPSMANDSLSGVILTAFLAKHLANLPVRHWSYRIVFVPETIGAISYCNLNEAQMKRIDAGLVITTVGGPGILGYKETWEPGHWLNKVAHEVLKNTGEPYKIYPFDIHGSDERQYSSQGFRINVGTISRDRYYEYSFYHSSLDDLDFVTAKNIYKSLGVYKKLIKKIETSIIYRNKIKHGEVMLSKHNLYPHVGGAQAPAQNGKSQLDMILWLLFLCDGRLRIDEISIKLGVPTDILNKVALNMVKMGVLEIV